MFQSFAENDAVRMLTMNCGHKPYLSALHSKVGGNWPITLKFTFNLTNHIEVYI